MIWSSVLAQLLHEVWASVMETQQFLMLVLNLHCVCVCVFDFQEVALLYKQGNSPLVCSVVAYPALKWFEEVRCG